MINNIWKQRLNAGQFKKLFCLPKCFSSLQSKISTKNVSSSVPLLKLIEQDLQQTQTETNQFLPTEAKKNIIDLADGALRSLLKNRYEGARGNSSKLLYGEKGIGKTSTFEQICQQVKKNYENVVPIHIEYQKERDLTKYPSKEIWEALTSQKAQQEIFLESCIELLKEQQKYCLLFVDELDFVYRGVTLEKERRQILNDLRHLGCQNSGKFYTYICGSSSAMPLLTTLNGLHNQFVKEEFSFLTCGIDLNGDKYKSINLHSGINKNDFIIFRNWLNFGQPNEEIQQQSWRQQLLEYMKKPFKQSPKNLMSEHLIFFLCGNNLRRIRDFRSAILEKNEYELKNMFRQENPSQWDNKCQHTLVQHGEIIKKLREELVQKNILLLQELEQSLLKGGRAFFDTVESKQWLDIIEPVTKQDLMKYGEFTNQPQQRIQMLVDRQWFLGDNLLNEIYPRSPLQLFYDYIENKYTNSNQIKTTGKTSLIDLNKIFDNITITLVTESVKKVLFGT